MMEIRDADTGILPVLLKEAEHMAISTIDWIYRNNQEEEHLTCEEMHNVKKSLQVLCLVHELKQAHKM